MDANSQYTKMHIIFKVIMDVQARPFDVRYLSSIYIAYSYSYLHDRTVH